MWLKTKKTQKTVCCRQTLFDAKKNNNDALFDGARSWFGRWGKQQGQGVEKTALWWVGLGSLVLVLFSRRLRSARAPPQTPPPRLAPPFCSVRTREERSCLFLSAPGRSGIERACVRAWMGEGQKRAAVATNTGGSRRCRRRRSRERTKGGGATPKKNEIRSSLPSPLPLVYHSNAFSTITPPDGSLMPPSTLALTNARTAGAALLPPDSARLLTSTSATLSLTA
jgi:hypothetical protein